MVPRRAGSYALIMRLSAPAVFDVGHLGRYEFESGWYAYAGSARGPGGLAARLQRHLRARKSKHWHLDYLRPHAAPVAVWYTLGEAKHECSWARALAELPGASVPAPRFGASDCSCSTHLIRYLNPPSVRTFSRLVPVPVLEEAFPA